jgi:hypothetical protein
MRDLLAMLAYECRRNPLLAELATQIDRRSAADIDMAPILPWMRRALRLLQADRLADQLRAQVETSVVDHLVADPLGELREWSVAATFLPIDRGQLQIIPGTSLWFSATGVWIDTIFTTRGTVEARHGSSACGMIRRSEYYDRLAARRRSLVVSAATVATSLSGVRIYRIEGGRD